MSLIFSDTRGRGSEIVQEAFLTMDRSQTAVTIRHPFDDGRGLYPDRVSASAPIGMRAEIRRAASLTGTTAAAFIRDAIDARLQAYVEQSQAPAIVGGGCGQEAR